MIPTLKLLDTDGTRLAASPSETSAHESASTADLSTTANGPGYQNGQAMAGIAARIAAYAAELTPDRLRDAYRHMVRARAFDQQATALQRQGELGLWASCLGQEAGQVGSAMATPEQDFVFPSYREHAVASVRGMDLARLLPVMRGTRHGGWDPAEHNFHIYTFVIGAHTLHAVGRAMAIQQDRRRGVENPSQAVVCYFGDGATSQGDSNEALIFAASNNAPVLFIVQNNHWAISVPSSVQSRVPIAQRADGFGIPRLRVDGNDILASYAATRYALEHIHNDGGPFFLELVTYRMAAHTTSDDPTRYRSREEEAEWAAKDPIARLRALLEREGHADGSFFQQVDDDAAGLARDVRESTKANKAGDAVEMFDHVYATDHREVARDRSEWTHYRARAAAATA
ncbi:MAG TPA: thiamine pyrophosphate-dependent dehydrogenase E1 component subunit alpha, partial [Actinomycetaceae bacterium]|nr:thiamine pyrophosphate-dependent dehydrogenase E1 component subunit alpha [Actinomycetaceae bacterium]